MGSRMRNAIAPEHVQLELREAAAVAPRLATTARCSSARERRKSWATTARGRIMCADRRDGALTGGLSVYTFLRSHLAPHRRPPPPACRSYQDAIWLGRAEGLEPCARGGAEVV